MRRPLLVLAVAEPFEYRFTVQVDRSTAAEVPL